MLSRTFKIPTPLFPKFIKEARRLQRKADKFGIVFSVEELEEIIEEVPYRGKMFAIPFTKIRVTGGGSVVINGWEVLAELERTIEGPIRTDMDGTISHYDFDNFFCDHCHTNRRRNIVYLIRSTSTGETIQVGSTCLEDFLGHPSARQLASTFAYVYRYIEDRYFRSNQPLKDWFQDPAQEDSFAASLRYMDIFGVEKYLALVEDLIRQEGFYAKKDVYDERDATEYKARDLYFAGERKPVSSYVRDALQWAATSDFGDNQYLQKLQVIAQSDYIRSRSTALAASILPAYQRHLDKEDAERNAPDPSLSQWVGTSGERLVFEVTLESVRLFERAYSQYGPAWGFVYNFRDPEGNALVWFTTSDKFQDRKGESFRIRGTVKKHDTYRNERQTSLSRVSEA